MVDIRFGTDGWRGLIAKDFTFQTVAFVTQGVVQTLQKRTPHLKGMIVGYDRRFLSREFAETVAIIYAQNGFEVLFAESFLPTPALSWCAKNKANMAGATVITASHNPPQWNGFKFKEPFGGSALPETTKAFEQELERVSPNLAFPIPETFVQFAKTGKIQLFNPLEVYFNGIKKQLDAKKIQNLRAVVGLDTMHGAGSNHYQTLLESFGVKVVSLHSEDNPGFRGVPPEPIEKNLPELMSLVKKEKLTCGLATDGDADRLGAVDENGNYFTTQQILSLVYWHMLKNRGKKWSIARSSSTTRMVDLIAARFNQKCFETPVGFKYIAEKIVRGEAQIGGEESGGIGIIEHIPERDALLTGLLLLEVIATTGKGLAALYEDLCREIRPYHFVRLDLHVGQDVMGRALHRLKENPPKEWSKRIVDTLSTLDGFKFYMKDGSWLLIRPSGTEPVFRLYAETESLQESDALVKVAKQFVENS